jgi:hypothetical protein
MDATKMTLAESSVDAVVDKGTVFFSLRMRYGIIPHAVLVINSFTLSCAVGQHHVQNGCEGTGAGAG